MATLEQIETALRAADAAGNEEDARRLAQAYADMRGEQAARPDFSNVQGGMRSTDDGRQADGWKAGAARDVMGGARSVIQGVGGMVGAFGGDAFNHYLVPGQQPSYRDAAAGVADRLGLPKPQSPRERIMADVGEGLTGTATTMGTGALAGLVRPASPVVAGVAGKLSQFLTAQPVQQSVATAAGAGAAGTARERGADPVTQLLVGLGAGMGVGGLAYAAPATTRGLTRGGSGQQMGKTIDDFAAVGATPSVGQASGRRSVQGTENLLSGLPMAEAPMANFAERQSRQIGQGLEKVAGGLTPRPSAESAGRAIEEGAETFKNNVRAARKALYAKVDQHIPDSTPVPVPSTWQALDALTTPTPGAAATSAGLISPKLKALKDNLVQDLSAGNGRLPYEALRAVRSRIGEEMDAGLLQQDSYTRNLSRVYAAISDDMEAAARSMGPAAAQAAKRANTYTKVSARRLEELQRIIDKNGGPEKVYQAAIGGTRDGGTTIRKVLQSLDADQQRAVTGAVIRRMGLARAGQQGAEGDSFSAQTFLTNWNSMSPEARRALFNRHGPDFVRQMDRIAHVAENIRDGAKVYANPAGTANRGAGIGYLVALATSLGTGHFKTAAGLGVYGGLANLTARAMTNPNIVRWLANSTTMPVGSTVAQIQTLRQIGRREGDEDAVAFADALEQVRNDQPRSKGE